MKNLLTRTLTGLLFVAVLIGATVFHPLSFVLLFATVTGLTIWEFCTVVNLHADASVNRFINTVAAVYLFFSFFAYCSDFLPSEVFIPYLLSLLYLLISELYLQKPDPLKNWAFAFASQIYVALNFSLLNVLAFQYDAMENRVAFCWQFPLAVFILLWANDTGAYLCGSALHKRFPAKLFERISPKKSWVGSIGGGVICLIVAGVFGSFFPELLSLWQWVGMGVVVCLFGTWGDLVESLLKRQLGIKDSGTMLPGHGGMLDRFDSSLLAIPAVVLYLYTLCNF